MSFIYLTINKKMNNLWILTQDFYQIPMEVALLVHSLYVDIIHIHAMIKVSFHLLSDKQK